MKDAKPLSIPIVHLNIGEFHFDSEPVVMKTVLGSCVSVCLYDPMHKSRAGMNHIFLPGRSSIEKNEQNARYGIHAMELLINEFVKKGTPRSRLHAKIFGGGYVIESLSKSEEEGIGYRNILFTREFLALERIPIISEDVGGRFCRTIRFLSHTSEVFMKKYLPKDRQDVLESEESFQKGWNKKQSEEQITLF